MRFALMSVRTEGCLFDNGQCMEGLETPDGKWCARHMPMNCTCRCGEYAIRSCARENDVACGTLLCRNCQCPDHGG